MRVLLPVDVDKDRASAAAKAVTLLPRASDEIEVKILNVQKRFEVKSSEGGYATSEDWYDEDDFPESVTVAESILQDAGITVDSQRAHDDPAAAIIDYVDEIDADWIVMAGRKRTPVGKVLFGSVTQSVLLDVAVPVTVVPRTSET